MRRQTSPARELAQVPTQANPGIPLDYPPPPHRIESVEPRTLTRSLHNPMGYSLQFRGPVHVHLNRTSKAQALLIPGVNLEEQSEEGVVGRNWQSGRIIMWVVFVVMLTVWLVVLMASGFGGLIHSLMTLCKPDIQPVPLSSTDPTPGSIVRY